MARNPFAICGKCRSTGVQGGRRYCDCATGQRVEGLDRVRERLVTIWAPRLIDFWMRTANEDFGGYRPADMVAEGRTDEVLQAIDQLPGVTPGPSVPVAPTGRTRHQATHPAPVPTIPDPPDSVRRVVATKFRRAGQFRIANALEVGTTQDLTPTERATLDAAIRGVQPKDG